MDGPAVDNTTLHRVWRILLIVTALAVATAAYLAPVILIIIGGLILIIIIGRLFYRGRDRYIPNLYSRDIRIYDDAYRNFIVDSLHAMRQCRIPGHTLVWEASHLKGSPPDDSDELLLDLGVWMGWSTRAASDASGRMVYGFDTFEGLVEDWPIEDEMVVKRGTFSLSDPNTQRLMRDTGVTLSDGIPNALGRKVHFTKGGTYETLVPFLAEHPGAPIKLFHMDLDVYESCLHALETCKDRFVIGSILVFDEYLVTNGELLAFYEFQKRYELEWRYRAWGLETWEMNFARVTSPWKRAMYYAFAIAMYLLDGRFIWRILTKRFWHFWLGAHPRDILFVLGAAGQRKSVSLEITGLGKLAGDP
ncbi:MtfA protein [uncultured Mycobacterium sp.]|uniref:MtfA protein n=1 Tax=uncultured Mycobacterium sp. TaxID=171292 RepID=A0A1Y5PAH0_9MYCO|nr:MtfA protein [uncultured Mycobacterium sp.]SBS75692.1 MtfA protein [uncultured Mycobacterium sp.]